MYSSEELRGLFWCLFSKLRSNEGNKYQNNTRVGPETVLHESTYIILFLTRCNKTINDDKNDDHYISSCLARASLARFSFCWWRHNRLLMTSQWPDNCDAITWIVISYLLDIDFIHGEIHDRSCKKTIYPYITGSIPWRGGNRMIPSVSMKSGKLDYWQQTTKHNKTWFVCIILWINIMKCGDMWKLISSGADNMNKTKQSKTKLWPIV